MPAAARQNRRDLAKAATRAKVLRAAEHLFRAFGYERATVRDIAAHAQMTTGAVFGNFTGKEHLYREIYGHDPLTPEQGRELLRVLRGEIARPEWLVLLSAQQAA